MQVLGLGQEYLKSSYEAGKLGKRLDEVLKEDEDTDIDIAEAFHHETGKQEAFKAILKLLGQQKLIDRVDTGLKELFPENYD